MICCGISEGSLAARLKSWSQGMRKGCTLDALTLGYAFRGAQAVMERSQNRRDGKLNYVIWGKCASLSYPMNDCRHVCCSNRACRDPSNQSKQRNPLLNSRSLAETPSLKEILPSDILSGANTGVLKDAGIILP